MTDLHALSGAYAVDALDADETLAFEEHLLTCHDCLVEVAELRAAADLLSTQSPTQPGSHVRDAVLNGIQQIRPLPPLPPLPALAPQVSGPQHHEPADAAPEAPGGADVVPLRRRRVRYSMAAAAAVLAVLGVGAAVVQPWADDEARLSATEQVLAAPDMTTTRADLPGGATAEVMRSAREDAAVLLVTGIDPAPAGKVYQVWWQHADGTLASAGMMSGTERDPMMLDGAADGMTGVGISVEPAGGSDQPTTTPLAMMPLPQA